MVGGDHASLLCVSLGCFLCAHLMNGRLLPVLFQTQPPGAAAVTGYMISLSRVIMTEMSDSAL